MFQGNPKCSGHVKGLNITEHAANGIYDGAAITVWERGSPAAVIWQSGGQHRGRLFIIKMPTLTKMVIYPGFQPIRVQ